MKLFLLGILAVISLPTFVNAEPASRYKVSSDEYPCTEEGLTALRLVNENYGKQLENKLINNTYYSYPLYFIYKQRECIFRVYAKEDRPTHTANMETFTVDICNKTIKAMWLPDEYLEVKWNGYYLHHYERHVAAKLCKVLQVSAQS